MFLQSYTTCSDHWPSSLLTWGHRLLFLHNFSHSCISISILAWFCLQQTGPPSPGCLFSLGVKVYHCQWSEFASLQNTSALHFHCHSLLSILAAVLHTYLVSFSWLTLSCLSLLVVCGSHQTIYPMCAIAEASVGIYNSLDILSYVTSGLIVLISPCHFQSQQMNSLWDRFSLYSSNKKFLKVLALKMNFAIFDPTGPVLHDW